MVKQAIIAVHIPDSKPDKFTHRVKKQVFDLFFDIFFIVDVSDDLMDAFRDDLFPVAPIQQPDFPEGIFCETTHDRCADLAGSSDK